MNNRISRFIKRNSKLLSIGVIIAVVVSGNLIVNSISLKPFNAFGGVVWADEGIHYIDQQEIDNRILRINAPYEKKIENEITQNTQSCDSVDSGYCQRATGVFAVKTLLTPAVAYVPGVPDTKQITGYCTLCRDGTFSPSCAVGRGACSWHGGVASYGVAMYRTIPGKPAIEAKPAVYSYIETTYKNSPDYVTPPTPSLEMIVANDDWVEGWDINDLKHYHNEIEKWHIEALTSLTLYQQIRKAKAPNMVGSAVAKENLNAINSYTGVFNPMQNATRISSFSNLSKIFIGYKNKKTGKTALSLDFLLRELELAKGLSNFDRKHLAQLKHKLKCNKKVKELRKLRNQQIAHIDLAPDTIKFSDKDFKDLLALSNDILMFSSWCINNHDQGENYYQTLASDIEMDFMKLLNALKE